MSYNPFDLKRLYEERAEVYQNMQELRDTLASEKRDMNAEEQEKFDKLNADFQKLDEKIQRAKAMEAADTQIRSFEPVNNPKLSNDEKEQEIQVRNAIGNYLRYGNSLPMESREILKAIGPKEQRDMTTTGNQGGYTIAQGFAGAIDIAKKFAGGVADVARKRNTDSGNDIPYPTWNDTSNYGHLIGEGAEIITGSNGTFGNVTLKAYKFSSDVIPVSYELLNDSAFNFENDILIPGLSRRVFRNQNKYFTTGSGTNQPQGFAKAAGSYNATNTSSITVNDIVGLQGSVDRAYRSSNSSGFMLNDGTLTAIKQLSLSPSSYSYPLWMPGLSAGDPDKILGQPYTINNEMDDVGAGNAPMAYGDWNEYIIRSVNGFRIIRLNETFALNDEVGFVVIARADGKLLNSNAIKVLQQ